MLVLKKINLLSLINSTYGKIMVEATTVMKVANETLTTTYYGQMKMQRRSNGGDENADNAACNISLGGTDLN